VSIDLVKVHVVIEWAIPRNLTGVQGFLGSANFCCQFIQNFAKLARPLNDPTYKDVKWGWAKPWQKAFDVLKAVFTSKPMMVNWDPDRSTHIEVDTSGFATGGVLTRGHKK
jgi:hypothetical protein